MENNEPNEDVWLSLSKTLLRCLLLVVNAFLNSTFLIGLSKLSIGFELNNLVVELLLELFLTSHLELIKSVLTLTFFWSFSGSIPGFRGETLNWKRFANYSSLKVTIQGNKFQIR